jgi:hypothetical protein
LRNEDLCNILLANGYHDYEIKKDEVGKVCSLYRNEEKFIQSFGRETEGKKQVGRQNPSKIFVGKMAEYIKSVGG